MPSADPSTTLPKTRIAIVAEGAGKLRVVHGVPMQQLEPDTVMVRVAVVAINPSDAKFLDYSPAPGAVHGCDFAGTVVALGEEAITSGKFSVGDRVAGLVYGGNSLGTEVGSWAEYILATNFSLLRIPDQMSFEQGATLPLGITTATLGLFHMLGIPATLDDLCTGGVREEKRDFVLVAGGSTASGARAIQLLKIAGLRPIATASPSKFDFALHFGAEKVFDYHSNTCAADIRAYTSGELAYALDCIAEAETTKMCYSAISRAGGRYVALEPFRETVTKSRALTIEPSWFIASSVFGTKNALEGEYAREAMPEYRMFTSQSFATTQVLLDRGLIEPFPHKAMPGGWEGVINGVDTIRSKPPSGYKLVYPV